MFKTTLHFFTDIFLRYGDQRFQEFSNPLQTYWKTILTYSHWERPNGHPKIKMFTKPLQPAARKIAKQKSRYILRATETSVEEKFFPRRYSVLNPKYVTALNWIKAKEKRVTSVHTSRCEGQTPFATASLTFNVCVDRVIVHQHEKFVNADFVEGFKKIFHGQ